MFWLYLVNKPGVWLILIVIVAMAITGVGGWRRSRRLIVFFSRPDSLAAWQARFPERPLSQVTDFLAFFANSFSLPAKYERFLSPHDRIVDIYRAKHPPGSAMDDLEVEALYLHLRKKHHVDLEQHWRDDITLGEIFELMRS